MKLGESLKWFFELDIKIKKYFPKEEYEKYLETKKYTQNIETKLKSFLYIYDEFFRDIEDYELTERGVDIGYRDHRNDYLTTSINYDDLDGGTEYYKIKLKNEREKKQFEKMVSLGMKKK